jgi:hypothetical protein
VTGQFGNRVCSSLSSLGNFSEIQSVAQQLELQRGNDRTRWRIGRRSRNGAQQQQAPRNWNEHRESYAESVVALQLSLFEAASRFQRLEELFDDPAGAVVVDNR